MRTKTQILLLTILGNVLIAGIFLILSEYRTDKQQRDNLAASAGLYQQAWDTLANDAFSLSIGEWHPQTGLFEKRYDSVHKGQIEVLPTRRLRFLRTLRGSVCNNVR